MSNSTAKNNARLRYERDGNSYSKGNVRFEIVSGFFILLYKGLIFLINLLLAPFKKSPSTKKTT
jgi:hypothetical protein